jgi:ParB-like nuclease domain
MKRRFRGILATVDWNTLCAQHQVEACAHAWVTDASIAQSLEHLHFDDPAVPHHRRTHRANRIASIVLMMEAGVRFDALRVRHVGDEIHLLDGHHRLRAYQFRRKLDCIPVLVCPPKSPRRCRGVSP